MDMTGEQVIPAPRARVWAMLNDPAVLRDCIPGCTALEGSPDTGFTATVTQKIGPVQATFQGEVTLSDVRPPESYTISGSGKGGVAGFAKGSADIRLEDAPEGTRLVYNVSAQVGGKLAQLGSRLIDSTARKLAGQFFDNLEARVTATTETPGDSADAAAAAPAQATDTAAPSSAPSSALSRRVIIGAVAAAVVLAYLFFRS